MCRSFFSHCHVILRNLSELLSNELALLVTTFLFNTYFVQSRLCGRCWEYREERHSPAFEELTV